MIQDIGLLSLRLGLAGLIFAFHGLPLLSQLPALSPLMVLKISGEIAAPMLIAFGFATRIVAVALALFCLIHWGSGELALTYAISFLVMALIGPGRLALDSFVGWFNRR